MTEHNTTTIDGELVDISNKDELLVRCVNLAKEKPVAIRKNGRVQAFVISAKLQEQLRELFRQKENDYWAEKANKAYLEAEWVGSEKSEKALQEILDAET